MLELHSAERAFERIEEYLRAAGFFGDLERAGADQVADVYLGYGLSDAVRRRATANRPEPARLPLAACRIRSAHEVPGRAGPFQAGAWEPSWDDLAYARAVALAREAIADGEVYQVNLVQHLSARFDGDPIGLSDALAPFAPLHPEPMLGDDWAVVSASPELFLSRVGQRIRTMPIKGTRPSGGQLALRASAKDAAEHVMIVDLERNDLGRLCIPGSVAWPELMQPRSMTGVEHLVSRVEGLMRDDVGFADTLAAMFPGGSVTGAPKIAALDHINALEPVGRGASMGALGTVWPNGDFELALTIRTFAVVDGRIHLWVGGGVVWDSEPMAEVEESWVKARPILKAVSAASQPPVAA